MAGSTIFNRLGVGPSGRRKDILTKGSLNESINQLMNELITEVFVEQPLALPGSANNS